MVLSNTKIELAMARKSINKTSLAELVGISRSRLNVVLNSKNVSPMSAGRIAKALGVDVTEIIETDN